MLAVKFGALLPHLDERQNRLLIGAKPSPSVTAESERSPVPPVSAKPRCLPECGNSTSEELRWDGSAGPAAPQTRRRSEPSRPQGASRTGRARRPRRRHVAAALDHQVHPLAPETGAYAGTQDMRNSVKASHAESGANSPVDVLRPGANST